MRQDAGVAYVVASILFLLLPVADLEVHLDVSGCYADAMPVYATAVAPPDCPREKQATTIAPIAALWYEPDWTTHDVHWVSWKASSIGGLAASWLFLFVACWTAVRSYRRNREEFRFFARWLVRPHGPRLWVASLMVFPWLAIPVGWLGSNAACRACAASFYESFHGLILLLGWNAAWVDTVLGTWSSWAASLDTAVRIPVDVIHDVGAGPERWGLLLLASSITGVTWYLLGAPLTLLRESLNHARGRPIDQALVPGFLRASTATLAAGLVPLVFFQLFLHPTSSAENPAIGVIIYTSMFAAGLLSGKQPARLLFPLPSLLFIVHLAQENMSWSVWHASWILSLLTTGVVVAMLEDLAGSRVKTADH